MQVLISTSSFNLANFAQLSDLEKAGVEVKLNPFAARLTENQAIDLLGTERALRLEKLFKVAERLREV